MIERFRSISGRRATVLVAVISGLLAALLRLPWLATSPPGFSLAEARAALVARDLPASDWLLPRTGPLDSQEPLFTASLWLTGTLAGWDVDGARLAAALFGVVAVVGCALWYRRALGPLAGLAGGVLVAAGFPWLVLSRQAQPAIVATALAGLGLWCLWQGLGPSAASETQRNPASRRGWWVVAAGLVFGLGFYAHPAMLPALVVVPVSATLLYWRSAGNRIAPSWMLTGLACLLLLAAPFAFQAIDDPDNARDRIEQDWDGDGQRERLTQLADALLGHSETLGTLAWTGHDTPTLGGPDRPLLDPLLLLWSLIGVIVIVTRPLDPLAAVTIIWLVGFGLPAALFDPGNPPLLAPMLPALGLLPVLGANTVWERARQRGDLAIRIASFAIIATLAGSVIWSLYSYREWSRSDTTYLAFDAGLRESLAAVDDLRPGSTPVYIATTPETAPLLDYLGPDQDSGRIQRAIDSRGMLVIPADGIGYVVTTSTHPLPADLHYLLDGQQAVDSGEMPSGTDAWQIRIAGQPARDRLPWTLPALGFTDGFNLAGFDIRPDLGDVATTGELPDPPRVVVTLVWDIPRGATPHIARVRLVPAESVSGVPEEDATLAEAWLTASPPIAAGNRGRELVVVRMSVPVPESPDRIVTVQAGLARADGTIQLPTDAGASAAGEYVILNRIQYIPDSATP